MMRKAIIVSVTEQKQLEIPAEIQANLHPGDEYIVWETKDGFLFKKVQKNLALDNLLEKVKELGTDPNQPTLEEISQIVRNIRASNSSA
ncbi:hypothetical protein ABN584_05120 [Gloeocapsa sp. BRSZ]|uniref:hypothetical protein n=1 Tax=Gloeocapsa sp. PCC 7428 TaxID=1173026 RepID=UPI0002A5EB7D|nr:hypothetical protein [Gloeocapsa sp. PCC 7428]AFZ30392.1 hypothetical protein Glo7428_1843 [Gloeocapsa sp. PCC 7428]